MKNKKPNYVKNNVFKEHLKNGLLPKAKTWGKKDQTTKQKRNAAKREINENFD